jgi:hypothetical protein
MDFTTKVRRRKRFLTADERRWTRIQTKPNYRFLTPPFSLLRRRSELPVFDASKTGG